MTRLLSAAAPLLAVLLPALPASAAFITTNELEMESIFAENGLDLDLRFNAQETVDRADLLSVDDSDDFVDLLGTRPAGHHTVNMFFVDTISTCGGESRPLLFGCARVDGNGFAVESRIAAAEGGAGAVLNAHELGHNFGLTHVDDEENLMDPNIRAHHGALGPEQLTTIEYSRFTQSDRIGGPLYTVINPIVVVPEPATALLLAVGLTGLALRPRIV